MNLMQLKYIVEVEKTQSITKAAENLFMNQPNLSRAIRDLEESLGITVFKRTTKGMLPTREGEDVLQLAHKVLSQVEAIETLGDKTGQKNQSLRISTPRASYISHAFTIFVNSLDRNSPIEIDYNETNSNQAIANVLQHNYDFAVVRFRMPSEKAFLIMFEDNELKSEKLASFKYNVIMSKNHPLAKKERLEFSDLKGYIELVHGDPYVPLMSQKNAIKTEISDSGGKRIFIYERGSQFDLLNGVRGAYMWSAPLPEMHMQRNNLVSKECGRVGPSWVHYDYLVYRNTHRLSDLDRHFIKILKDSRDETFGVTCRRPNSN